MITTIVGIWLLSILIASTKAKTIVNNYKQDIIATYLAQEGIETIINLRNTNILKNKNYKNFCRLNQDYAQTCDDLNNPNRIKEWNYTITNWVLSWISNNLDIFDGIWSWDLNFALCLQDDERVHCSGNNNTRYWKFFRSIEWKWLFIKDVTTTWWVKIICDSANGWWTTTEWIDYNCAQWDDLHPMEFQFCSKVQYVWTKQWAKEICSIITNFFE